MIGQTGRLVAALLVTVTVVVGCSMFRSPRSAQGHTFRQLMRGVPADPAHFSVDFSCVLTDETSVGGREVYLLQVALTNLDDVPRTFTAWIYRQGAELRRLPRPWQDPGETQEFTTFLAWADEHRAGCPSHDVAVYQNAAAVEH